jgi:hypothetical protein
MSNNRNWLHKMQGYRFNYKKKVNKGYTFEPRKEMHLKLPWIL